jgi:hypothetical protein
MYFMNPVVFLGAGMLVIAVLTAVWRLLSKGEYMRTAADVLMKVTLVWCATFLVLGSIMAITAAPAHARCKQLKASGGDIMGCQYFFDTFGE